MNMRILLNSKLRRDYALAAERLNAAPLDEVTLARNQLMAVQRVWQDATADIPYYAGLVRDKLAPAVISTWEDFRQIPYLKRQVIQDHPELFVRRSRASAGYCTTAGSTGTPLKIGMDQAERDTMRIVKMAEWQRFGYKPDSRLFLIWGHSHLLGTGWRGRVNHLRRKAADCFMGYKRVDAYRMAPADCRRYAAELIKYRPLGVVGYASALDMFATHVAEQRNELRNLAVKFVMMTAESLPRPESHALLADTFGCPVVQEYGGVEFGQVAFEVGHGPFEVYSDLNYLEALVSGDDGSSDLALIVTTLYPRYLPLIRYEVGDACRNPDLMPNGHVRRFSRLAGRVNDQIVLSNGAAVHSVAIFHCIHQEAAVLNIQMRLTDLGITINLLASNRHEERKDEIVHRVRARLMHVHPELGRATIEWADDLQTNRAGKRRWFVDERTVGRASQTTSHVIESGE